jgi:hypothetical protein
MPGRPAPALPAPTRVTDHDTPPSTTNLVDRNAGRYVTLSGYIGAMLVAGVYRNVADGTGMLRIEPRVVDDPGTLALVFSPTMALTMLPSP